MRYNKFVPAALSVLLVTGLAACSSSGSASSGGGSSSASTSAAAATSAAATSGAASSAAAGDASNVPSKKLRIAYASPVQAQPGQQQFDKGAKAAAALSSSKYTSLDSAVSSSKQITNMQTMLQQVV